MRSSTGFRPAIGAVVLCAIGWFSIAAWQDDLAQDQMLESKAAFRNAFVLPINHSANPSSVESQLANRSASSSTSALPSTAEMTAAEMTGPAIEAVEEAELEPWVSDSFESDPSETVSEIQDELLVQNETFENETFVNETAFETNKFEDEGPELQTSEPIAATEQSFDQQSIEQQPEEQLLTNWEDLETYEAEPVPPLTVDLKQSAQSTQADEPASEPETNSDLASSDETIQETDQDATEEPIATDDEPRRKVTVKLTDHDPSVPVDDEPGAKWAKPTAIYQQLDELDEIELTRNWSQRTRRILEQLEETEISDTVSLGLLKQIGMQQADLSPLIVYSSTVPVQHPTHAQGGLAIDLRRLSYRLERRMRIWTIVCQLASQEIETLADLSGGQSNFQSVSNARLNFGMVHPKWHEYLKLDSLSRSFNSFDPEATSEAHRRETARQTLARVFSPSYSKQQQSYARNALDPHLVSFLKQQATERDFEFADLVQEIEKHESRETGATSFRLNNVYQNLIWSENPASQALAAELESEYRNANFRMAVSARLINLLIPQIPSSNEPISENLLGAQINGQSQINSKLKIDLIPDPTRIHLNVVSLGHVLTQTQAQKSGVTVDNEGASRFQVFKQLAIGRGGISSRYPVAFSQSKQRITGLRSNLDSVPVLGWVARKIAQKKIAEQAPATEQYTKQKLEQTATQKVQQEVESKLAYARQYMNQNLIQPLVAMDLEPEAIEMATTTERIITRWRLAGRDQMAAYTSRPRALSGSLLSVQIHDSMINNLLMRIELNGQTFKTPELVAHLQKVMGVAQTQLPEQEKEVEFQFADRDPIRLDFEDGKLRVQMNLKSLQIDGGKRLRNISASTYYIPYSQGMKLVLIREEDAGLDLNGRRKPRDRAAIYAVFREVYKDQFELSTLPKKISAMVNQKNLKISQLVMTNGWIGISINEASMIQPVLQPPQVIREQRARILNFGNRRR